jgi:hypothetical protein
MQSIRIRVERVVDFGTIVSLIGVDTDNQRRVTVHADQRPFEAFWQAWREAGFPQPIKYDADGLTLRLDTVPDDDREAVRHD